MTMERSRGLPPKVTGISPKDGIPGTTLVIRGENLGLNAQDLVNVMVCDFDCILNTTYVSPSKISCKTGFGLGNGEVIVTTRSGGEGTCTVTFRSYLPERLDPMKSIPMWIEEDTTDEAATAGVQRKPIAFDDPLGLPSESMSEQTIIPKDEIDSYYPNCDSNISSDKFHPIRFLLEKHCSATFDDLKNGLEHLREKVHALSSGPQTFLKRNITNFLAAYDTLTTVYKKAAKNDSWDRGLPTITLESSIKDAAELGNNLFDETLRRKDKADSIRNALGVLQRFRFLFNLPSNIERNVKNGEFEIVINDYDRVRSLFANTEVQVFQKVLKEVESQIDKVRALLKQRLNKHMAPVEEQKRIIRYLIELNTPGDPAWECIVNKQKWLIDLFMNCREDYMKEDEKIANFTFDLPIQTRRLSVLNVLPNSDVIKKGRSNTIADPGDWNNNSCKSSNNRSQIDLDQSPRLQFVEEMCDLLMENLASLWKLGQMYVSGTFTSAQANDQDQLKRNSETQEKKFMVVVGELAGLFCNLIKACFLPAALVDLSSSQRMYLGVWPSLKLHDISKEAILLKRCISFLRSCLSHLAPLNIPISVTGQLQDLCNNLKLRCTVTTSEAALQDIKACTKFEVWVLKNEGDSYITDSPYKLESSINNVLTILKDIVITVKPGEIEKKTVQAEIQAEALQQICKMFLVYLDRLDKYTMSLCLDKEASAEGDPITKKMSTMDPILSERGETLSQFQRLLVISSDCYFVRDHVLVRILSSLQAQNFSIEKMQAGIIQELDNLVKKIFRSYIKHRGSPMTAELQDNMYVGNFTWDTDRPTRDVNNYIKEALMRLIEIHAEITSVSPTFAEKMMAKLVEQLLKQLSRLIRGVPGFSQQGRLQAHVDLSAFAKIAYGYIHKRALAELSAAFKYINATENISRESAIVVDKFLKSSEFQFYCFEINKVSPL